MTTSQPDAQASEVQPLPVKKRRPPLENAFPNCPLCAGETTLYKFNVNVRVIACHRCETVIIEGDSDSSWGVKDA
jgi:transcription elongation factor Elf1